MTRLRVPGRGVVLVAAIVVAGLVSARVITRSVHGEAGFDDWFFLGLSAALLVVAVLWWNSHVDLGGDEVRVVNGIRSHHIAIVDVVRVDVARAGDLGDDPHVTTSMRVPLCVRIHTVDGLIVPAYGLAPDARTRRDPERWQAYLAQVAVLAEHCGSIG